MVGNKISESERFASQKGYVFHDILYLQPDNIGFDVRGDVKIFDLGLAKELSCSKDNGDGTYQLTGDTGSPRYMAPEGTSSYLY